MLTVEKTSNCSNLPTDVSAGNAGDMFVWMSKEHLCVLVYVVTVMHSMQAGYMDKAQKYTEKAFLQIEKLKCMPERNQS